MKSNLCNYNDVYILVRSNVTIIGYQATQVAFKNCAPFTECITKFDGATRDDPGDLDLVMLIYNLIEYSPNCSETTESLWFFQKMKQLILMQILLIPIILNLSSKSLNC